MVSHIQQPGFIGSSPADIAQQGRETAMRWAQIVQQGMQTGLQAYQFNKELKAKKEMAAKQEQSAMERLRFEILAKDVASKFESAGVGNEGTVLLNNKDEVYELLKFQAGGDGEKATAMLEGIAKQISPATLTELGSLGLEAQGQAPAQGQAKAPSAGVAPMTWNAPSYAAPSAASLTTTGRAIPQAPAQIPTPAQAQGVPQVKLKTPIPENAQEVTPEVASQLAQNPELMASFRSFFRKSAPGVLEKGTPQQDVTLIQKYPGKLTEFLGSLGDQEKIDLINGKAGEGAKARITENAGITLTSKGIPKATLEAAQPAISAIQKLIMNGLNEDVEPKAGAAFKQSVQYNVKVLDNPATKKLLSVGVKREDLEAKAQQYQDFINNNPDAINIVKAMRVFSDKELGEYNTLSTQSRLIDKMISETQNTQDKNEIARQKLALDATLGPLKLQTAYDRISAARDRTTSEAERAAYGASMDALKLTQQYISAYTNGANAIFTAKKKDSASPEEKAQIIKEELKNKQGALYLNLMGAAQMYAKANGYTDVNKAMVELQAQHLIDLFGFQAIQMREGERFEAPEVFPQGGGTKAPAPKTPSPTGSVKPTANPRR
jgi:glucan-binding YG repeat protein